MPITTLDPVTALIVIDLQKGIVTLPTAHPIAPIIGRARMLTDAFRSHGLPVVLVHVIGRPPGRTEGARFRGTMTGDFADFVSDLMPQPGDHVVSKRTAGAFTNTDLEAFLRSRGVTQVVVTGVSTSMGVESTARQAYELDFNVTMAVDVMTDMDADLHASSSTKVFPRLGETGNAQDIIDRLASREP